MNDKAYKKIAKSSANLLSNMKIDLLPPKNYYLEYQINNISFLIFDGPSEIDGQGNGTEGLF